MRGLHCCGAARNPRADTVGAAGENDRHARAENKTGAVGPREEGQDLCEDIARFEVGREQNIRVSCDLRVDAFGQRRLLAYGVVECKRPVQFGIAVRRKPPTAAAT